MPRLLLVDDNQRIHQIVETLLTATDIELTCASSGAEALELIAARGAFDVALLDTTMQGMDGWELLDRLRRNGPTALMPIAMMAGVLDVVDPETIRQAPIQGFLKKPVELRDLADRVRTLLATPVEPPAPEPEPVPEAVLEPEPVPEPAPSPAAATDYATMPYFKLSDHPLPDSDLLLLDASDLLEEEPPAAEPPAEAAVEIPFDAPMESLELEELDLESLKGLSLPSSAEELEPLPPPVEDAGGIPEISPEDAYQSGVLDLGVTTDELPDLGPSLDLSAEPGAEEAVQPPSPHLQAPTPTVIPMDWSDESETLLEFSRDAAWPGPAREEPTTAIQSLAAAAMEDHSDFDPDSFLDQEPGPEPTPAFLPDLPDHVTPHISDLAEAALLPEAAAPPEIDELPGLDDTLRAAGRDTVPPWATTVSLPEGTRPAVEPVPADTLLPAEELPPAEELLPAEDLLTAEDLLPEEGLLAAEELPPCEEPVPAGLEAPASEPEAPPSDLEAAPEPEAASPALEAAPALAAAAALAVGAPLAVEAFSAHTEPAPAAPAPVESAPATAPAADPLAALLADPVLMDRLAKAVVARLGDQTLREIAWEVMPEMADRLHRN